MNLNQAIITTKNILNGASILQAVKDEEGDWQFLDGEDVREEDVVILSLQQVINLDETVRKVLNINKSSIAFRGNKKSEWNIKSF